MEVILIAAIDENRGIGYKNNLLKPIKEDLKRFQKLTYNNPIIMGKNTWDSLPVKPLKGRINCVIARPGTENDGFLERGTTVKDALSYFKNNSYDKVYVIGGEKTYREAMTYATKLELTHIKGKYKADRFFPSYESRFKLIKSEKFDTFTFATYKRRKESSKLWKCLTTKTIKENNMPTIIMPNKFGMLIYRVQKLF